MRKQQTSEQPKLTVEKTSITSEKKPNTEQDPGPSKGTVTSFRDKSATV